MSENWNHLYVTDKTGKWFWPTIASPLGTMSEIRNLKRLVKAAKAKPERYRFLDAPTAVLMLNDLPYSDAQECDDAQLLAELEGGDK